MEKQPNIDDERSMNEMMTDAALEYLRMGFRPIRLVEGAKRAEIRWKEYQARPPNEAEIRSWFGSGKPNIGLVTGNGLVVVDVDDPKLLDEVLDRCGETPMKSRTPRGGLHLFYGMRKGVHYGNAVKINDHPLDLRCEGAYVVEAWSHTPDGSYQWIGDVPPVSELPLIRVGWLREKKPKCTVQRIEVGDDVEVIVRRARAYLSRVEGSISGKGGHKQAMRAAGVLTQKFGLTFDQAWPLFKEWSQTSCEPPWGDAEITHKLREAIRLRIEKGLKKIE